MPNAFLMSLLLFGGTFLISWHLKKFKFQSFFSNGCRNVISDFAVIIAILTMTTLDYLVQIETPKLTVPGELRPTWSGRGWLIEPFGTNPWYSALAASIPALLATILLFMDQQITAVIVNRKEHKLCVRNICCICITLVVSSEMELHIAHCTFIVAAKFAFDVLKDIHTGGKVYNSSKKSISKFAQNYKRRKTRETLFT